MEIKMEKKVCTKCNKEKNLTEYHKKGNGHRTACKECANAYRKKYHQENAEKVKAYKKKYREEYSEKVKARKKNYYQENAEKIKARHKKYYQENLEKVKAQQKKYRQENAEEVKAQQKKYREENLEKVKASARLTQSKRRAQKINTQVEDITDKLLNEHWVKNNIDPEKCYHCGEAPYEHLDHYMPYERGGTHTKENLVPSCAHCNCSKGSKTPDEWDEYRGL